jgi:hypothetical protein
VVLEGAGAEAGAGITGADGLAAGWEASVVADCRWQAISASAATPMTKQQAVADAFIVKFWEKLGKM